MSANREFDPPSEDRSEQNDLWDRLLSGELDADNPEVARQFASDSALAEKWAQLQRLGGVFDRVASEERHLLSVASEASAEPRLNLNLNPLAQVLDIAPEPAPSVFASRGLGAALALAAAVVVAWFLVGQDRSPQEAPLDLEALRGKLLAESDFEVRLESGADGSVLRWDLDPELGWFDLAVFEVDPEVDPQEADLGSPLLERRDLFDNQLDPTSLTWPTTENALWIRVTQRIEGVTGAWKTGGLLVPPGSLLSLR